MTRPASKCLANGILATALVLGALCEVTRGQSTGTKQRLGCAFESARDHTNDPDLLVRNDDSGPSSGGSFLTSTDGGAQGGIDTLTGSVDTGEIDFGLGSEGPNWTHRRTHGSTGSSVSNLQGERWRHDYQAKLTFAGTNHASDATIVWDANTTFTFTWDSPNSEWDTDQLVQLNLLTHDAANDEMVLTLGNKTKIVFHDYDYGTVGARGKLKLIEDVYGRQLTFTYDGSGVLTDADDDSGHRFDYSYVSGGANDGQLDKIKIYKTSTETSANLIGQIEFTYHDGDSGDKGGELNDLLLVVIKTKATGDGDGVLSIVRKKYYRYWDGTYDAETNPGDDHRLKYRVGPEASSRLLADPDVTDPLTADDSEFSAYKDNYFEHDSNGRVSKQVQSGTSCGCGGGSDSGTWTYAWTTQSPSDKSDPKMVVKATRDGQDHWVLTSEDGAVLTTVTKHVEGETTRYRTFDHVRDSNGFRTSINYPSANTDFNETTFAVTSSTSAGKVEVFTRFGTGDYENRLEYRKVKKGTSGSVIKVTEFDRTVSARPDLATTTKRYESESGGGSDPRAITVSPVFYTTPSTGIKTMDRTLTTVSTAKNGSGVATVQKTFYDLHGRVRWTLDGDGYVTYYGYDENTNVLYLIVRDVNTTTLPAVINDGDEDDADGDDWDGRDFGYANRTSVPFSRSGSGTALDLITTKSVDPLGRVTKVTEPGGMVTYSVHLDGETREYPAWEAEGVTDRPYLAVWITKRDHDDKVTEVITADPALISGWTDPPDGTETIERGDYLTWSKNTYDDAGAKTASRIYFDTPSSGAGTAGSNYYETTFGYDETFGKVNMVKDPEGGIVRTVYNAFGWVSQRWEGTDDTDATDSDPTGGGAQGNNMVKLEERYYDDEEDTATNVGDRLLTRMRRFYGTGANDYNGTDFDYDYRGRLIVTKPPSTPYSWAKYDNQARLTATGYYSDASGLTVDDPDPVNTTTNRIGLSQSFYDELGRVHRTQRHEIDSSDGSDDGNTDTDTWYGRRGRAVARKSAGSAVSVTKSDGAGRPSDRYTLWDWQAGNRYTSGAFNFPDLTAANNKILGFTSNTLNSDGRATTVQRHEINHNNTDGGIKTATADSYVRTSTFNYYDDAGRLTEVRSYGADTGSNKWKYSSAPSRPGTPEAISDSKLGRDVEYDAAGRRTKVKDPYAIATVNTYDDMGRLTEMVEDSGTDMINRSTQYEYDGNSNRTKIIADGKNNNTWANGAWAFESPANDTDQVTTYEYESTQNKRWLTKIRYPSGDGTSGSGTADTIAFTYNADGTITTRRDQNNGTITYAYDSRRRRTAEKVTTLGSGVDGDVRSVTTTYDNLGRAEYVTAHSDSDPDTSSWTDAVSQIKNEYNGLGQINKQWQDLDGKVIESGGSPNTLNVQYGYSALTGNYSRLDNITYPNGRKLWYGYTHTDSSGFQDDANTAMSRIGQIALDNAGAKGDVLAQYDFNGARRMVVRDHKDATGWAGNDIRTDLYAFANTSTTGEYKGLDRFGRQIKRRHIDYTDDQNAVVVRWMETGFDRNSNLLFRREKQSPGSSQLYTYDNLSRLIDTKYGLITSGETPSIESYRDQWGQRAWTLDDLGNPTTFANISNSETREYNESNEITSRTVPDVTERKPVDDDFSNSTNTESAFSENSHGTGWSVVSGKYQVDALMDIPSFENGPTHNSTTYNRAMATTGETDWVNLSATVDITWPSGSGSEMAGLIFGMENADHYMVVFGKNTGTGGKDEALVFEFASNSWTLKDSYTYSPSANPFVGGGTNTLSAYHTPGCVRLDPSVDSSTSMDAATKPGKVGLFATATGVKFDNYVVYRTDRFEVKKQGRWLDNTGRFVVDTATDQRLEITNANEFPYALAIRPDVEVKKFKLTFDLPDANGATAGGHDNIGAAFGVKDAGNFFAVYQTGTNVELLQVTDGGQPVIQTTGSFTPTNQTDYVITVEVVKPSANYEVTVKEGANTLINAYNISQHNYDGGLTGIFAQNDEMRATDDVKLEFDVGGTWKVQYNDSFASDIATLTYDDAGNTTDDGLFKHSYDAWNRLKDTSTTGTDSQPVLKRDYDALGRLMVVKTYQEGDQETAVVRTDQNYYNIKRQQIIEVRDGSDNVERHVVYGTQYIDEVVAIDVNQDADTDPLESTDDRYFALQDATWNVVFLAQGKGANIGAIVEHYRYDPYGNRHTFVADEDGGGTAYGHEVPQSTVENTIGHKGRWHEPATGLTENRARHNNPRIGRWMQWDPLGFVDGLNAYNYLSANPVGRLDPTGMIECSVCWCEPCLVDPACTCCLCLICNGCPGIWFTWWCPD